MYVAESRLSFSQKNSAYQDPLVIVIGTLSIALHHFYYIVGRGGPSIAGYGVDDVYSHSFLQFKSPGRGVARRF